MNFKKLFLMLTFFVLLGTTAFAQTYFVSSTGGDDSNFDGTSSATPFATIEKALSQADVTTIYVADGTYNAGNQGGGTVDIDEDVAIVGFSRNGGSDVIFADGLEVKFNSDAISFGVTGNKLIVSDMTLTKGVITIEASNVEITDDAVNSLITRVAGSLSEAPTFLGEVNVTYANTAADIVAGYELPADLGDGLLTVNGGKAVTFGSAVAMGGLVTGAGSTASFMANATLNGDINNAGTVKLNSTTLTWSPAAALTPATILGNVVSETAGSVGGGTVVLTGDQNITTDAAAGEVPSLTLAAGFEGVLTLGANLTVAGNLTIATPTINALTDNAKTIFLKGNFVRTNQTLGNVTATGTLTFNGVAANQSLNAGANLTLANVTVDNPGKEVSLSTSVTLNGNLNITNGKLNVGSNNLYMDGTGMTFTNGGEFLSTTGVGYLIFTDNTNLTGTGTFSNLDIRNNATVTVTGATVKVAQNLIVRDGVLALGANNIQLVSTSYAPTPKVTIYTVDGTVTGAGMSVAPGVTYDLVYIVNGAQTATAEWIGTSIRNLTISKGTATALITAPAAEATTISGTFTLSDAANSLSISGDMTFATADMTHSVEGTMAGAGVMIINAGGITINGKTTDDAGGSELVDVTVNNSGSQTFTLNQIQKITGNFTYTGGSASINFNPELAATISGNFVQNEGTINLAAVEGVTVGGIATLTAGTLNVNGDLTITGAATQSAVNVAIASGKKLTLLAAYTHDGAGTITGSGTVVARPGADAAYTITNALTIPNLEVNASVNTADVDYAGASDLTVSNTLVVKAGELDLNAKTLKVTGNTVTVDPVATSGIITTGGAGVLSLSGSAPVITIDATETFPNVTLNSTGTLTLKDDDEGTDDETANQLTIPTLTQTAGGISTGQHDIIITTALARTAGSWTQSTTSGEEGWLVWNSATPANFAQGAGFTIANLSVLQAATIQTPDKEITINNNLIMNADITMGADEEIIFANKALITKTDVTADFTNDPLFGDYISVSYNDASALAATVNPGREVTAANDIWDLKILDLNTQGLTLTADLTFYGTLEVAAGEFIDADASDLLYGNGSWVKINAIGTTAIQAGGGGSAGPAEDAVFNVEYATGGFATTDTEFDEDYSIGTVKISGATDIATHLTDPTFTNDFVFSAAGDFDVSDEDITLKGDVTQTGTGFFFQDGSAVPLKFAGTEDQLLTLKNTFKPDAANLQFNVEIALAAGKKITLSGANLDFTNAGQSITLTSGALETSATAFVILLQSQAGGVPTQGFTQTNGVIVGNVKKQILNDADPDTNTDVIANSVVTYPLGDVDGKKKTATFYFKTAVPQTFDLSLNYNPTSPGGTNLNIISEGHAITNYPPFNWYVKASQNVAPSYKFDMELGAEGYLDYVDDEIQNVRLIRRDSGNVANQWKMQGEDAYYYNSTISTDFPVVKVVDATGGLTVTGAMFTYSQRNKRPTIAKVVTPGLTIDEGDTLIVAYTGNDVDINQDVTLAKVVAPSSATFAADTLKWVTTNADSGSHKIIISATDGIETTYDTLTVTVTNINQAPVFTTAPATQQGAYGVQAVINYVANDSDGAADSVRFSAAVAPTPTGDFTITAAGGVLSFTPEFADAGHDFTFTIIAKDKHDAADTAVTVFSVTYGSTELGDVTGDGSVGSDDATPILRHLVELDTLSTAQLYFANVDGDADVTTNDAHFILYYAANDSFPSARMALAGTTEFGELKKASPSNSGELKVSDNEFSLPISFQKTSGILSVYTELTLNGEIEFQKVTPRVPDGWVYVSNYSNGVLRIAMAGTQPLTDGNVATIDFKLNSKDASASIQGFTKLNGSVVNNLNPVKVKNIPAQFSLSQNYPNPFNPTTVIEFALPENANVNLEVYNVLGQKVRTLMSGAQEAGYFKVNWDGRNDFGSKVSSGIYIYRIVAGKNVSTMKMNLLK